MPSQSALLQAVHAMGDTRTLLEVCAAQRDRVTKATAAAPSAPRSSLYHKLRGPRSLTRLLSGPASSEQLPRTASIATASEATAQSSRTAERPALAHQGSWVARMLCCGGSSAQLP